MKALSFVSGGSHWNVPHTNDYQSAYASGREIAQEFIQHTKVSSTPQGLPSA